MPDFKPVSIGLVGVGGYAGAHLNSLELLQKEGLVRLTAAVVRTPGKYPELEKRAQALGATFRASFDEMLAKDRAGMEIVDIPTGIDSHRPQMIQAVEAGLNVLLEKPTTATIQDFDAMEEALRRSGRFCAIGFQSQSSPSVLHLKRAICAGRLGKVRDVVATGHWRRDENYYQRNAWAGKLKGNDQYILDGTINNPMAHYLFNSLFFASNEMGQAAMPVSVRAELYHGHRIESEDTSCLEVLCDNGVRVCFYGTLCAAADQPIRIEVVGDRGRAVWTLKGSVQYYEGETQVDEFSNPANDGRVEQFRNVVRYLRGIDKSLNCPLQMTRAHVLAVNGAFTSMGRTAAIPEGSLKVWTEPGVGPAPDRIFTTIVGIDDTIARAARARKLFSDLGVTWAVKTQAVEMTGYKRFELT